MPRIPVRRASLLALLLLGAPLASCGGGESPSAAPAGAPADPAKPAAGKGAGGAAGKGGKNQASALLAYQTGLQLLLKGSPPKALAEFERAVQLDPSMSEAYYQLGRLQFHLSSQNIGSQARDLEILDQAIAALGKARDLEPVNDHYWFWLGRAYGLRNDSEQALAHLGKAVELNAQNAWAWKTLGLAQMDAAQTEAARASFERAIEVNPKIAGAHFQLGQALEALRQLEQARSAYEAALTLDPTDPEIYGRLLVVCGQLGDAAGEERARTGREAWMERERKLHRRRVAVNQNPGDAAALRRLGEMYFEVGKWEEALEWFVKAIHIDPQDALTHLYCGVTRRQMEDYVNAANHLKEAEFLAPDNLDPKLELLRLYAAMKDDAAARELVAAVELAAASDGASLWDLAEVCRELGRSEDSARLFAAAKAQGVTAPPEPTAPPLEEQ